MRFRGGVERKNDENASTVEKLEHMVEMIR